MKTDTKLVSVLMTAYNRQQFIAEAIESVLNSTYQNWELIIVDDGSKDDTVAIAKSFAAKDSRIQVYVNEKNLGDYPNRNKAASFATGDYIMYVDSDDKILADGFDQCIKNMQQFPQAGIGMQLKVDVPHAFYSSPEEAIKGHFFKEPSLLIGPGGTILRRSFFEAVGKYPVKYGPANDMYFNIKAVAASGVVFLPFNFMFYRIHQGQEFNNKYSYLYNNYLYLHDALQELHLPLTAEQIAWLHKKNKRRFVTNISRYLFTTFQFSKTLSAIKMARFGFKDFIQGIFH